MQAGDLTESQQYKTRIVSDRTAARQDFKRRTPETWDAQGLSVYTADESGYDQYSTAVTGGQYDTGSSRAFTAAGGAVTADRAADEPSYTRTEKGAGAGRTATGGGTARHTTARPWRRTGRTATRSHRMRPQRTGEPPPTTSPPARSWR